MTDSTQRELRMLANRMLTQTEAKNGYQGSPIFLLLRKDAEKAMAMMTKAADLVDVLESSLRLQAEVAADANAQLNLLRGLAREYLANDGSEHRFDAMELHRVREAIYQAIATEPASKPTALPLEIAGSLLPDDYVSPRLAAEAYMENGQ
jgi:hypothetical protein